MNPSARLLPVVAWGALFACGGSTLELEEQGADEQAEQEELSRFFDTYLVARRDTRKCASPACGGWYVTDVNGLWRTERYVSRLDFERSGFDAQTVAKVNGAGEGELLLRGRLGSREQGYDPLLVLEAWRGMPGARPAAGDGHYSVRRREPLVFCVAAPCPNLDARRLNGFGLATHFDRVDVSGLGIPHTDSSWLETRALDRGGLVAGRMVSGATLNGRKEQVFAAHQVYAKLPVYEGSCPVFRLRQCPNGGVHAFTRSVDRCLEPAGCVTPGVCAENATFSCAPGYREASWIGGHGCPVRVCDPDFLD